MNERKKIMFEIEKISHVIQNEKNSLKIDRNLQISNSAEKDIMILSNVNDFKTQRETIEFNFTADQVGDPIGNLEGDKEKSQMEVDIKQDLQFERNFEQKHEEMFPEFIEEAEKNFSLQNQIDAPFSFSSKMNKKNNLEEKSHIEVEHEDINNLNISFQSCDISNGNIENKLEELKETKTEDKNNLSEGNKEVDLDSKFNQGRWSCDEHLKFIEAMWLYGNEWKKVQTHIGSRTSSQARSHAQKFFIRLKKKFTSTGMNKVMDLLNEENFGIIIDWINESLDADHLFLYKNIKFDESAKKFCRVIINLMNNSGDIKMRRKSTASKNDKPSEEVSNRNHPGNDLFKKDFYSNLNVKEIENSNLNFKQLSLFQNTNYNIESNEPISPSASKIKISLPSDSVDDYFNFNHSETPSEENLKINTEKDSLNIISEIQNSLNIGNVNNESRRNSLQYATNKIFLIKKMNKKRNSDKIKKCAFKKRRSSILKKNSSSNISRISCTSSHKEDINKKSIKISDSKILMEKQISTNGIINPGTLIDHPSNNTFKQTLNSNLNQSSTNKTIAESINPPCINTNNNNSNIFIDPNKNHFINIVNINYACNENKMENKTDPVLLKNIINNITSKSAHMPINNMMNYQKEFSDFNSIFNNVKSKINVNNQDDSTKNSVTNLDNSNKSFNNNNLINYLTAQRIFNNINNQGFNQNNNSNSNDSLKNLQMNLLYQLLYYRNQNQAAILNQLNNKMSNMGSINYNPGLNSNLLNLNSYGNTSTNNNNNSTNNSNNNTNLFKSILSNSGNHSNDVMNTSTNYLNFSNMSNINYLNSLNYGTQTSTPLINNTNAINFDHKSTISNTPPNSQNFNISPNLGNFNNNYQNNINSLTNINTNSNVNPMNNTPLNANNGINNAFSLTPINLGFDEPNSSSKLNNPFNISFDDKNPFEDDCLNIFNPLQNSKDLFIKKEKEKEKEDDSFNINFDLSEYFKGDGY